MMEKKLLLKYQIMDQLKRKKEIQNNQQEHQIIWLLKQYYLLRRKDQNMVIRQMFGLLDQIYLKCLLASKYLKAIKNRFLIHLFTIIQQIGDKMPFKRSQKKT
ncbi:hypothetical protein TTHERM_001527451 (macronuclear) [Tetrahymena thermophila SB210]|uniref:Uncharacterized protein n=1 Tax=Tetrahymena thermophila (strain SB210) TaxID=312017 RepID=W7WXN1_TETTS|nr:hypothetical protein TTHERM_001527451 [Tetrahymena thermophila SB210]EWS71595.1 hypothetical protein TTHERM_001527451 [Tetrahymena thermophila SB210]|eukprot:XP_012655869.1 hypothetical protein TTHERM_001527451 [Tetrahymena thermophila SB210]